MPGVQLKTVRYFERVGKLKEWILDGLTLGPVNLLVGKNATGKTRTLNVIWSLARAFVPEQNFRMGNGGYELLFDNNGQELRYNLNVEGGKITEEKVYEGEHLRLQRTTLTKTIYYTEEGKTLRFQPPETELAAVARRDSLQHPFLEPLHEWAHGVRHYTFGATLGKDHVAVPVKEAPEADERNCNLVVAIFKKAVNLFGPKFIEAVIADMAEMHYFLDDIMICPPETIKILHDGVPADLLVMGVKERGIGGVVEQNEMSQGMFRAMSILIQVNYSQMAQRAHCVLIDDIGEGLDFDRSTLLIDILRRKAKAATSSFQLIMATNDQFVMDRVPLEEWSLLQRDGSHVRVRNQENSKEAFEHFRFVGMSNFSFFEMDFLNGAPEAEEEAVAP